MEFEEQQYMFIPCATSSAADKAKLTKALKKCGYRWAKGENTGSFSFTDSVMRTSGRVNYLALCFPYKGLLWSDTNNYNDLLTEDETYYVILDRTLRVPTLEIIMGLANGDPEIGFNMFIQQAEQIIQEFEEMCDVSTSTE